MCLYVNISAVNLGGKSQASWDTDDYVPQLRKKHRLARQELEDELRAYGLRLEDASRKMKKKGIERDTQDTQDTKKGELKKNTRDTQELKKKGDTQETKKKDPAGVEGEMGLTEEKKKEDWAVGDEQGKDRETVDDNKEA